MNMNVVELASRLRSQAATQLILCKFPSPTPSDGTAWVWVFGESAGGRLKQLWAGVLERAEGDTLADELGREKSLWLGGIHTLHAPPSKRFRLGGRGRPRLAESIRVEDWPVKPSRGPSRAMDFGA